MPAASAAMRLRGWAPSGGLRSFAGMVAARGASIAVGTLLAVLLARWMGAEGYGAYLFTITLANFLALPVLAGLPTLVIREIAAARGRSDGAALRGILRWSIGFVLVTSAAIGTVGALVLLLTDWGGALRPVYLLALPLIVALAAMQLAAAVLQGFEQPFRGSLPDTLLRPAALLVLAALAALGGALTPEMAVLLHILAAGLAAIWAIVLGRRIRRLPAHVLPACRPRYHTRAWLAGLLPLSLIAGAALLNTRLDVLMLAWFTDTAEIGRYGIAMKIAALVAVGPGIVNTIVQPRIARIWGQGGAEDLRRTITLASRMSALAALVAALAILGLGGQAVIALVGEDFRAAIPAMLVLAGGRLAIALAGPVGNALNMTGHAGRTAGLMLAFSGLNAALNLVLVPIWGMLGAAAATSVALVLLHVAMVVQARRVLGLDTTIFARHAGGDRAAPMRAPMHAPLPDGR